MSTDPSAVTQKATWPALPLAAWKDTYATLHMWTQIVGKIRMALTPRLNHWWNVPLYVTCQGLSTSPIAYGTRSFHIGFDFRRHELHIGTTSGAGHSFPLVGLSVADFYRRVMAVLEGVGVDVEIWPVPVEVEHPIPFEKDDQHATYDPECAAHFWQILMQTSHVFEHFRSRFLGKTSPVHFFWGAFDLAVTRFSGRAAPPHPGGAPNVADEVMHEAYSHEVSSAGFWPGAEGASDALFYSYAYPEPDGFRARAVEPGAAYYHEVLGEFVLPYEAVRTADDSRATLLRFLQSTYEAAATQGQWDRDALERTAPSATERRNR